MQTYEKSIQPGTQETRRSNARRACSLILRIARFVAAAPTMRA